MSRETEKVFKEFDKYMKKHGEPESEEEFNDMLQAFMQEYNSSMSNREPVNASNAQTSDDYMDLAEQAESIEEALRFARKALKLDPDNLDAETYIAVLGAQDNFDNLKRLENAIEHGNQVMEAQGYFEEEYIGDFWGVHQTRPYMRLRKAYINSLIDACMFDAAVTECEDLLRLCDGDNIGARYTLMHIYALQGNAEKAQSLLSKYDEDGAMMLMPLALLYYKRNDLSTSLKYLKRIQKHNPDLKKFLRTAAEMDDMFPDDFDATMFRPYTIDEINITVFENDWLYVPTGMFFVWANEEMNAKGKSRQTRKKR